MYQLSSLFTKLPLSYAPCFNLHIIFFLLDLLREEEGTTWQSSKEMTVQEWEAAFTNKWLCSSDLGPRRSCYRWSFHWENFKVSSHPSGLTSWPPDLERFLTIKIINQTTEYKFKIWLTIRWFRVPPLGSSGYDSVIRSHSSLQPHSLFIPCLSLYGIVSQILGLKPLLWGQEMIPFHFLNFIHWPSLTTTNTCALHILNAQKG